MLKYQKILVPTDFSPCSQEAYQAALSLAMKFKSILVLLHVIDQKTLDMLEEVSPLKPEELAKELHQKARVRLRLFLEGHPSEVSLQKLIVFGLPFQEIINITRKEQIDLIIMGRYGGTGELEKILFGSTAEKVVRMAPCAVLSIPLLPSPPKQPGKT